MKSVAIVIPIYKTNLNGNEKISLFRCIEVFQHREIIFVYPEGLDITVYKQVEVKANFISFEADYFKSVEKYSLLLNLSLFYKPFLDYQYILIYQLDAYVFSDQLDYWMDKQYDYIGAPWINASWIKELGWLGKWVYPVGNGGFSLRRVKKFYYSSKLLYPIVRWLWRKKWNEDFFWTSFAHRVIPGFNIPTVDIALQFAFEQKPSYCFKKNNSILPMGCHAWEKYEPEFWEKYIPMKDNQ